jgi:hypothetical protein
VSALAYSRMIPNPLAIDLQRLGERISLSLEIIGRIEEKIIDLGDGLGDVIVWDTLQHDRRQALVEGGNLLDFPPADGRMD